MRKLAASELSALIADLQDEDASVRAAAALALANKGNKGPDSKDLIPYKDAIPYLIYAAADDQNHSVRANAQWALGQLRRLITPYLVAVLKDKSAPFKVRGYATWALGKAGRNAKDAVPDLMDTLKNESVSMRYAIVCALGKIGQNARAHKNEDARIKAKRAISALINRLHRDVCIDVRGAAAWALGNIGPDVRRVVRALMQAFSDKDGAVRAYAVEAVREAGQSAVPELKALRSRSSIVRACVKDALERIENDARWIH